MRNRVLGATSALVMGVWLAGCGGQDPETMKPLPEVAQPTIVVKKDDKALPTVDKKYVPIAIERGQTFETGNFVYDGPSDWIDATAEFSGYFKSAAKQSSDFSGVPNMITVFEFKETPDSLDAVEQGIPLFSKELKMRKVEVLARAKLGGLEVAHSQGILPISDAVEVNADMFYAVSKNKSYVVTFSSKRPLTKPNVSAVRDQILASWRWK